MNITFIFCLQNRPILYWRMVRSTQKRAQKNVLQEHGFRLRTDLYNGVRFPMFLTIFQNRNVHCMITYNRKWTDL
ncbi:hypothetical protein PAECIP111802_01055 [Paenibacillus allorhizosphaerae]|uniref:Uncharacterized protein n=1 Tax=Paenibacillus allorhizosphaerae TaxID=2849866 RepID=A0ABM8VCN6_9BACL|nr:hypothetical protein PAECIP111802_01055 [Paenibacillus allorhizosphaerae]